MRAEIRTQFDIEDAVRTKPNKRGLKRGAVKHIHIKMLTRDIYTVVYTVAVAGKNQLIEEGFLERDV